MGALAEISATIKNLQNQIKTVVRDSPDQRQRDDRINEIRQGRSKSYAIFKKELGCMSLQERNIIRFGALPWLWKEFPKLPALDGKVGNPDDPGDGLTYDESHVSKATTILNDFYRAWSETPIQTNPPSPKPPPKVGPITSMAKICLILCGMKQQRLVDYFCESQKTDIHLPLSVETAKEILHQDREHATTFVTEQYRVVRRDWKDGGHIEIPEEEPLPLSFEKLYGRGSYASVERRRDAFEPAVYAVKEEDANDARSHLQREVKQLKKVDHRHIVQFVKSYQRGSKYAILIRPAATTDLEKLLERYRKNNQKNTEEQRKVRVLLRPILLTAFGCLSHGLSHIHGRRIRHRDIKPANILYEKVMSSDRPARFLWADFGLAYHFGTTRSSKTRSKSQYSRRYAAPERMEPNQAKLDAKAAALAGVHTNQDTDDEDTDDDSEEPLEKADSSRRGPAKGRSMDIFSFGCVFLEILSTMTDAKIPNAESDTYEFWRNVTKLQGWAESQKDKLKPGDPLRIPFALAIKMIRYKARKRPTIDKIVEVLADTPAAKDYFCPSCLQEVEKLKAEREEADKLLGLDRDQFNTKSSENTESGNSEPNASEYNAQEPSLSNGVNGHKHPLARLSAGMSHTVQTDSEPVQAASKSPVPDGPRRPSLRTITFAD